MRRATLGLIIVLIACGPYFYHAPPSLGSYPERIAAKRWPQIFNEAAPLDPNLPSGEQLDEACRAILEAAAPMAPAKRVEEIDLLLAANRSGDYSSQRANFLYELRELAVDETLFSEAKAYIEWRVVRLGFMPKVPISQKPWDMEQADFDKQRERELAAVQLELQQLDLLGRDAPPSVQPYWKNQRAAYLFEIRQYADAAKEFMALEETLPDHPRSEVAALMRARCGIEQSRVLRDAHGDVVEFNALLDESAVLLGEFIHKHPKGRFIPDAEGWLGAIAFDRGQWGTAVKQQLARLERQPTREISRTVLRECDQIFGKLLGEVKQRDYNEWGIDPEGQFDAAAVARHPLVARLFVQHCIDPAAGIELPLWFVDRDTSGRETIDFLKRRILNPQPFIRVALRELGKELMKVKTTPDDVSLTLLAWAATEDGEHEQALALLDQIRMPSDESLQAKAITLQRLGRDGEALSVWDELEEKGASHLASDLRYRRSLSWFKSGKAGKAIVEIIPSIYPTLSVGDEADSGMEDSLRPPSQLLQWLDTLVQFSPLSELELAYSELPASTRQREVVGCAIRTRALASRDFETAAKYLTEEASAPESEWEWMGRLIGENLPMTRADWDQRAAPLVGLYAQLAAGPPERQAAEIHLAIARHWMDQRGRLSMPSLVICYFAASQTEEQDLLRRRNAQETGFSRDLIHRELDHRDEATHALEHALEAAKSSDSSIAAPALELANQCLFRRAEVSLYQKSRALETGATLLSADIHKQLCQRFASSPEAKRSVFYTFSPTAGPWMPGDYNPSNAADALISSMFDRNPNLLLAHDEQALEKIGELQERFNQLAAEDFKDAIAIRKAIERARHDLSEIRPHTDPANQTDVLQLINRLDDVDAAASVKGATVADVTSYANGNMDKLSAAFADLLEFRKNLSPIISPEGFEEGPKNDTIAGWREFLQKYPGSPKAEAASFRMTRLIARQFRSSRCIAAIHFPDSPIPNGYKHVLVERMNPSNDPDAVLAAIKDHEDLFPQSRYRDDLNLLRAGALIDAGRFSQALVLLEDILGNPLQRDIHVVAALEFSDMAQQLLDPEKRLLVAIAFRRTPGAMDRLNALVNGDTFLSRLKPLMMWVEGQ